jgi:hypothetical protein
VNENLQKAAQPTNEHEKIILQRVLDYGAACRVHGVGPEVAAKFRAVADAVHKPIQINQPKE